MGADSIAFLRTPAGQSLLREADRHHGEPDELRAAHSLRRASSGIPAEHVSEALTQVRLRRRAASAFGTSAGRMFFTAPGLEQATHPLIARRRAVEAAERCGAGLLVDLGCGIGADLTAFVAAGFRAVGVDHDPYPAAVAAANLRALGLGGTVAVAAAKEVAWDRAEAVFVDPARRRGSARLFDPREFSPPWSLVDRLLARPGNVRLAVVKTAPGLDHGLIPADAQAEWVSLNGDLRELTLWSPPRGAAKRSAVVLGSDPVSAAECSDLELPPGPSPVAPPGDYLYEPDDAVVRAHLVAVVADRVDGWLLDPHLAYVSSDQLVATRLARAFRVHEVLPFQERALRAALRQRGIGDLTIKKRGVAVTPEQLRRRLGLRGSEGATIVLSRTPRSAVALLVEPLSPGAARLP